MRRRDFVVGLVLTTTLGRAQAQQKARVYRIAVVTSARPVRDWGESPYFRAFFQGLRQLGYIEGQNLSVERYSAEGRTEHYAELAAEVIRSNPDLIFIAASLPIAHEVKASTASIPVVAVLGDPVAYGIVSSLARPGGNITGGTGDTGPEIWGKLLELLHEVVPAASRVAWLATRQAWEAPDDPTRAAARSLNITLIGPPLDAPFNEAEYRRVFAAMMQNGPEALLVSAQAQNLINRRLIVELAEKARLPAIYYFRDFTDIGGLVAYGPDLLDVYRHAADQVDQVLKGAKPGDIPFYQPTKFTLTINLKTAKALGITVPPTLVIAADEVIE